MLEGERTTLRPVRESDLDRLYEFHQNIANRGRYVPIEITSQPAFRKRFRETGLWKDDEGTLLIVTEDDEIVGHVEFFETVAYLDELELSYHIYTEDHRGKGVATEAVKLMTGYLFDRKKNNRIRLVIHPENTASKRVAEKCGYKQEGVARGAWFHRGRSQDVEIYALLRGRYYEST